MTPKIPINLENDAKNERESKKKKFAEGTKGIPIIKICIKIHKNVKCKSNQLASDASLNLVRWYLIFTVPKNI